MKYLVMAISNRGKSVSQLGNMLDSPSLFFFLTLTPSTEPGKDSREILPESHSDAESGVRGPQDCGQRSRGMRTTSEVTES